MSAASPKTSRDTDGDEASAAGAPAARHGESSTEAASPGSGESSTSDQQSPLSMGRLRAAFAQMLGGERQGAGSSEQGDATAPDSDPGEIIPRSVVEAMLFVGRDDGGSIAAREMAVAIGGVSPAEIDAAVAELNHNYQRDAAPYHIDGSASGYRLALRDEFGRMRDKFFGRLKEAKLAPAAIEVLSIVAYNQPTTADAVSEIRGVPSGPALASLVRRKLVRIDRPEDRREPPRYSTTDRFLRLVGLENVAALPRSEELQKL